MTHTLIESMVPVTQTAAPERTGLNWICNQKQKELILLFCKEVQGTALENVTGKRYIVCLSEIIFG